MFYLWLIGGTQYNPGALPWFWPHAGAGKGRVERAHLTLQDRLVKELRLKGICTIEAANAFAEEYMADYNRRFAKEPLHDFNAYRPLALDDDLDAEFT